MESANVTFRPMEEKDLPLSFEIYASTRREEMSITGWPTKQIEEFLLSQAAAQNKHYKENYDRAVYEIIQLDGKDIGRLYVDEGRKELRIMELALLPEYRGQGIGRKIMEDLISKSEEKGLYSTLHVEENNPARQLFQRMGFEFVEERGVYHYMKRSIKG